MLDILYSKIASRQLKKINLGDPKSAHLIISEIEKYAYNQNGNYDIKKFKGDLGELRRLRVGKYRVLFDEDVEVLYILRVSHRQGAYHD